MKIKITSGLPGILITLIPSTLNGLPLSGANPLFASEKLIRLELKFLSWLERLSILEYVIFFAIFRSRY